jgi:hypothetical protein
MSADDDSRKGTVIFTSMLRTRITAIIGRQFRLRLWKGW